MTFQPSDPDFERRTRASFARQGAMALPFRPELSQQHGFFHAGIISTIADTAGGRVHCATGPQTLMSVAGRPGVKD